MHPPAAPIREELNDALIRGIRLRGPQAFGLIIIGIARLVIAALALAALIAVSSIFHLEITAGPFVALSAASGLVSWLQATRGA